MTKLPARLTSLIIAIAVTPASNAEQITDIYRTITESIPKTTRVCETVEIPVYSEGSMDTQGAIVGGLVGGLLGNQIGKGDGNKVAIGAGAITGAIVGGKKESEKIVAYRQEERCTNKTTYEKRKYDAYSHTEIEFYYEGEKYTLSFQKR